VRVCGTTEDEDDGLFLFRVMGPASVPGPASADAAGPALAVLAEADASQRDMWVGVLNRECGIVPYRAPPSPATPPGSRQLGGVGTAVGTVHDGVLASVASPSATTALATLTSPNVRGANVIPQWSAFKTRQSKATLQVLRVGRLLVAVDVAM
jgi:hypothetical protein